MNPNIQILSLHRPARYKIKVPGLPSESWAEWAGNMATAVENEDDVPVTVLTGSVDQATLQGLLRRLYAIGLPLISVICMDILS
jgi:hypothetical protein